MGSQVRTQWVIKITPQGRIFLCLIASDEDSWEDPKWDHKALLHFYNFSCKSSLRPRLPKYSEAANRRQFSRNSVKLDSPSEYLGTVLSLAWVILHIDSWRHFIHNHSPQWTRLGGWDTPRQWFPNAAALPGAGWEEFSLTAVKWAN